MKTWGRYDLVADPNEADVVFAVRFVDPVGVVPQIRVGIMDAKTTSHSGVSSNKSTSSSAKRIAISRLRTR